MSKSSYEQIEQDEKKILSELIKNSKENIDTIAKALWFLKTKSMENNQTVRIKKTDLGVHRSY